VPIIFFVDPRLVKSIRSSHILCALRRVHGDSRSGNLKPELKLLAGLLITTGTVEHRRPKLRVCPSFRGLSAQQFCGRVKHARELGFLRIGTRKHHGSGTVKSAAQT
jgi:hypothetical protein